MNVWVVGTGYVGLVTGLCFAKLGHHVSCIDLDEAKITALQNGISPIYEPGLKELLDEQQTLGNIKFSLGYADLPPADVALIAVGTPPLANGEADLSHVFGVVDALAEHLPEGAVLVTKSTVPVGTAEKIRLLLKKLGRTDLEVASVPEFLREGSAIEDTLNPNRLVFGVTSSRAEAALEVLHEGLTSPKVVCHPATAEMIKYASNAFLATKISFVNEIANICDRVGADVSQVALGMGLDPRIGSGFLRAGLGYGGSCFPKDTRALVNIAGTVNYDFTLLRAVVEVNQRQRMAPLYRLLRWFENLEDVEVTLLGVAFKPGTDDTRESPALDLAAQLIAHGARVRLVDPVVESVTLPGQCKPVAVHHNAYQALLDAEAAVLVTEWPEFLNLDWNYVRNIMKSPFVFDGRNVLQPETLADAGIILGNVGRGVRPARVVSAR